MNSHTERPRALAGSLRRFLHTAISCAAMLLAWNAAAAEQAKPSLAFQLGTNGGFTFDTGKLRGKLRADGKSLGLSSVVHLPSGTVLDRSMGLFSHYRLFTVNKRYGGGVWDMPSGAVLRADGAVEMVLPRTEERPFELTAVYRWHDAESLDLETVVKAGEHLPGFEVFLASYFSPDFTNALVFTQPKSPGGKPAFLPAERAAAYWHMYVRDDATAATLRDGRWKFPPYPVEWTDCGRLASPLAIRRAPGLKLDAVMLSAPGECFAIATPYQTESHYSLYLSFFGRDLKPGETARARSRLVLKSTLPDSEILRMHQSYLREIAAGK